VRPNDEETETQKEGPVAIFFAIVLGPACLFLLYALVQFWREAKPLRPRLQPTLPWSLTPVTDLRCDKYQHAPPRTMSFEGNKRVGGRNVVPLTHRTRRRASERDVA
jgi:hypothetical protein